MEWKNLACMTLHKRIDELYEHGLCNMWMSLTLDDHLYIGTVLGYGNEDFQNILECGGLVNAKGYALSGWQNLLRHTTVYRDFTNHTDSSSSRDGKKKRWVRFTGNIFAVRDINVDDVAQPYSENADKYQQNFFTSIYGRGLRRCRRITSELRSYMSRHTATHGWKYFKQYQTLSSPALLASVAMEEEEEEPRTEEEEEKAMEEDIVYYDGVSEEDIAKKYLEKMGVKSGEGSIEVTSSNGTRATWFRFPMRIGIVEDNDVDMKELKREYLNISKNVIPKKVLADLLSYISTNPRGGAFALTKMLYGLHPDAVLTF